MKVKRIEKILSYVAGNKVEQIISPLNGELNIYYINGKYILNAENTNYSFGELHKGFQKIFKKINLAGKNFKNVLILGFGVGSVASILKDELNKNCSIKGIEKDPIILDIGNKYFDISRFKKTDILVKDAYEYVCSCNEIFDLIVFDIYIDNKIPSVFEHKEFLSTLKNLVSTNGLLVFNKDVNNEEMHQSLFRLEENFQLVFPGYQKIQVVKNNWFFVWEN
jgi:spermidine synthase